MGQKYGYRPLQPRVAVSEFERLLEAVESKKVIEIRGAFSLFFESASMSNCIRCEFSLLKCFDRRK